VESGCGRGYMLQVAKNSAGIQQSVDFGVECALALMHDMMDREAGDDCIELAEKGELDVEVVGYHSDGRIAGKAFLCGLNHGGRKVERHGIDLRVLLLDEGEQAGVAGAQIEDAVRSLRDKLQQSRFAFLPMGDGIGAP